MGNDSSRSIGPIALPNGIIQLCLRNGIRYLYCDNNFKNSFQLIQFLTSRVDMTLDKAVRGIV